jgi:hypothetical protein
MSKRLGLKSILPVAVLAALIVAGVASIVFGQCRCMF